jgi:hypothetical protein
MRILFQMNANDSSNLMDSPVAARLGAQRAFFYSEDQGKMEKFRPYGLLTASFLSEYPQLPGSDGEAGGPKDDGAAPSTAPLPVQPTGNGNGNGAHPEAEGSRPEKTEPAKKLEA